MMLRAMTFSTALLIATVEPTIGDVDLLKYGFTQGGLFIVVVILLIGFRREFRRQIDDEKQRVEYEKARNDEHRQTITTLVALVGSTNTSMQQTVAIGQATEQAIHRLANTVDRWDGHDRRQR